MPTFTTPVAFTGPRVLPRTRGPERDFFRRASPLPVGRTVLKEDGEWVTVDNPPQDRLDAAERVFLGGHVYEIDYELAAELILAGYASNII